MKRLTYPFPHYRQKVDSNRQRHSYLDPASSSDLFSSMILWVGTHCQELMKLVDSCGGMSMLDGRWRSGALWATLIMLWLHSLEISLQFHRTIYKHICLLLHTATVPSPVFYHLTSHHTFSQLSLYCTEILCYPIGLSACLHSSHRSVGSSNHPSSDTRNFIHHCQGVATATHTHSTL